MKKTIIVDSREHQHVITQILKIFEKRGFDYMVSKLPIADYALLTDMSLVIDRKRNLNELCSNVGYEHERFSAELLRAQEHGIKVIVLCEHGHGIRNLADVAGWVNPRAKTFRRVNGRIVVEHHRVMQGATLCKTLMTMEREYGVQFLFCEKWETGDRIIDLLTNRPDKPGGSA